MKSRSLAALMVCLFFICCTGVKAQNRNWNSIDQKSIFSKDSITRGPYTLIFICLDSGFNPVTRQRMIDAFFDVYPREAQRFNPKTATRVTFVIDSSYKGVAATGGGIVRYSPDYMKSHPEDIDVVTHEVMHIVQDYGRGGGPGWLTEGIADYVRFKFGVNNEAGKWSLTPFKETQSYTNSYRITARFLVWLEKNHRKTLVDELDTAMRTHTYTPEIWKTMTGKTLDELWQTYAQNPAI